MIDELIAKLDAMESLEMFEESTVEGLEASLVWEAAKTAGKIAGAGINAAKTASKQGGTLIKDARTNWVTVLKPKILAFLKEFQHQLSDMWRTMKKYDQKYAELGKEINHAINVYGRSISSLESVSITFHAFDPDVLVGYMNTIQSYDKYMDSIMNTKSIFEGRKVDVASFLECVKRDDSAEAQSIVGALTSAVQSVSEHGDLGLIMKMWQEHGTQSIFNKIDRKITQAALSEKISIVEFTQRTILRNELTKDYSTQNINEFRRDLIIGERSYLGAMRFILNNRVIDKVLQNAGGSIKKRVDTDLKNMDVVVKETLRRKMGDNPKDINRETPKDDLNKASEEILNAGQKNNIKSTVKPTTDGDGNESFADFFKPKTSEGFKGDARDKYDNKYEAGQTGENMSMVEIADQYIHAYSLFMSKVSIAYTGIVRGTLAATYDLVDESYNIVKYLKAASGANKAKTF